MEWHAGSRVCCRVWALHVVPRLLLPNRFRFFVLACPSGFVSDGWLYTADSCLPMFVIYLSIVSPSAAYRLMIFR